MGTSDGSVIDVTKIIDNGPPEKRWNLVLMSEGYQSSEMDKYHTDAETFCNAFFSTKPFDTLKPGINVHRIDVSSTDSGATDPKSCGGQDVGSGDTKATYFDATFCNDGKIRRLLAGKDDTVRAVANDKTPHYDQILVIINSSTYGGAGGSTAWTSTGDTNWPSIAIHEMGHAAFGLADEYESYGGCDKDEPDRYHHDATEPSQPNVTVNSDPATIKWKSLVTPGTAIPTSTNADCTKCDPTTTSPVADGTVGAFEGAHFCHCGAYRPGWDCIMRTRTPPFCGVCSDVISKKLSPYLTVVPAVTGISPTTGPAAGGTQVVITGSGFTGATSVGFGNTGVTQMNVDSDTQITATSTSGNGQVDVTVIGPNGTSATSSADQFTYDAASSSTATAPTVSGINPTGGPSGGGTKVVITGTGFTGATSVGFGNTGVTQMNVDSDTQITATSPQGSGTVDVTVITPAGTSATGSADQFTYDGSSSTSTTASAPSVSGINPTGGPGAGGTQVVITGSGFTGATSVGFGNTGVTQMNVDSDTQITATSPQGTGTVDVTVITPAGTSATSNADQFTYDGSSSSSDGSSSSSDGSSSSSDGSSSSSDSSSSSPPPPVTSKKKKRR